jgi:hypothetical protein
MATDRLVEQESDLVASSIPATGAAVVLGLDRSGFIRTITTADAPSPSTSDPAPVKVPSGADRETRITRMACLNTATAMLTTRNARRR